MKTLTLTLFILFIAKLSLAQTAIVAVETARGKWGYATPSGQLLIEPQYDDARSFRSGGVALTFNGRTKRWQFINKKNEVVTLPFEKFIVYGTSNFFSVDFMNGMLVLDAKGHKRACINEAGEVVYIDYDEIYMFMDSTSIGRIGKTYYVLDQAGNKSKINTELDYIGKFKNGYAPFRLKGLHGMIDKYGNVVVEPKYDGVGVFIGGIAWARTADRKVGFIDMDGAWVVKPQFTTASNPDTILHIARVRTDDMYQFVRSNGEIFSIKGAISVGEYVDGVAWAKMEDGKIGVVNGSGDWIIQPEYDRIEKSSNGVLSVRKGDLWGAFTNKGEQITPCKYTHLEEYTDGLIAVRDGALWGFIDVNGEVVIEPQFDAVRNFKNGYAAARKELSWGLIDKKGNFTIEPQYHRVIDVIIVP